jgi:hypothetical protein
MDMCDTDNDIEEDLAEELINGFEEDLPENEIAECEDFQVDTIGLAAAAGFGYCMATDELDERILAENILGRRSGPKQPIKVPLKSRHEIERKGTRTPFGRWSTEANLNPATSKKPIKYTKEEQLRIIRGECSAN